MNKFTMAIMASVLILGACQQSQKKEQSIQTKKINNMETSVPTISDFPVGEENKGFAQYFSGKSWLAPLTSNKDLNVPIHNVTFEPGCRNNWHSHSGGQILICVGGAGYYQERGKKAVRMEPRVIS